MEEAKDRLMPFAQWESLEADVVTRIRILRDTCRSLENNPTNRKIVNDLVIPNLRLLGQFCQNVSIEE